MIIPFVMPHIGQQKSPPPSSQTYRSNHGASGIYGYRPVPTDAELNDPNAFLGASFEVVQEAIRLYQRKGTLPSKYDKNAYLYLIPDKREAVAKRTNTTVKFLDKLFER